MSQHTPQGPRPIPLEQRFQPARIHKITVAALELELLSTNWAKWARVALDHLLPKRDSLQDYRVGEELEVFLDHPSRTDPGLYRASLRWAIRDLNPWLRSPPIKGELAEARVDSEWSNRDGQRQAVFVTLLRGLTPDDMLNAGERTKSYGMDARLPLHEVPGEQHDILDALDIGDDLIVQITEVHIDLLHVTVSIRQALKTLGDAEDRRRTRELLLGNSKTIQLKALPEWGLSPKDGPLLGILGADIHFSGRLQDWLEAFGYPVQRFKNGAHLARVLKAPNRPTTLLCDPGAWPPGLGATELAQNGPLPACTLYWLGNTTAPFNAPLLPLPLNVGELDRALQGGPLPEPPLSAADRANMVEYQGRQVQELADQLLQRLCNKLEFSGALWIARERKGAYEARASFGIDKEKAMTIESRLGQTVFKATIEQTKAIVWPLFKLGPLAEIAPADTRGVACIPIPMADLQTGESRVERAVAFFYPQGRWSISGQKATVAEHPAVHALTPYLEAMQALVQCLRFARHNERLSAFAELGRHAATYLHELRERALPLREFLNQQASKPQPGPEEIKKLSDDIQQIIDLAHTDLKRIGREQQDRLRLRERLERLGVLYDVSFNKRACAFQMVLPEHPLSLDLNPLVVEQTISNLLDNALEFVSKRPGVGKVTLSVRLDPELDPLCPLLIEVEDNGSGVRAGMVKHLYTPRFTDRSTGTGMGLFIARGFMRDLGAELTLVDRIRWYRTCFQVRLPIVLNIGLE